MSASGYCLQHSLIACLAEDVDSKCVATADSPHDNKPPTIMVWNIRTGFPINSIPITSGHTNIVCSDIIGISFIGKLDYIGVLQFIRHNVKAAEVEDENRGEEELQRPLTPRRQMISIWKFGHSNKGPNLEG